MKSKADLLKLVFEISRLVDELESREAVKLLDQLRAEGLRYAMSIVSGRRLFNRPPGYLAALDEIEIFLKASIERVENGEDMHSTAIVQQTNESRPPKETTPS